MLCAVLSCAASGCSGGGPGDGVLDAAGAGGAADVSSVDAPGGAADDPAQDLGRIPVDEAAWVEHRVKFNRLGDAGACPDCRARVAEPLPLPAPGPPPFKFGAANVAR